MRLLEDWEWLLRLCQDSRPVYLREVLVTKHERQRRVPCELAERCTRIFLEKHDADFRRDGWGNRRWVRAKHFERLAEVCFRARQFRRGNAWLIRSFAANPFQNPIRLGAFAAAPFDALVGSSLIENVVDWKNQKFGEGKNADPPAG